MMVEKHLYLLDLLNYTLGLKSESFHWSYSKLILTACPHRDLGALSCPCRGLLLVGWPSNEKEKCFAHHVTSLLWANLYSDRAGLYELDGVTPLI